MSNSSSRCLIQARHGSSLTSIAAKAKIPDGRIFESPYHPVQFGRRRQETTRSLGPSWRYGALTSSICPSRNA